MLGAFYGALYSKGHKFLESTFNAIIAKLWLCLVSKLKALCTIRNFQDCDEEVLGHLTDVKVLYSDDEGMVSRCFNFSPQYKVTSLMYS